MAHALAALSFLIGAAALAASCSAPSEPDPADGRSPDDVVVMVLGTYHFANPGLDLNNMEADDVLAPRRQAELDRLAEAMAAFEPTVVAVEAVASPPYEDDAFAAFTEEALGRVRNEREQIGYRVAKRAGVSRVYAIDEQPEGDEPEYFPFEPLAAFAESEGRADELSAMTDFSDLLERVKKAEAEGIAEALIILNEENEADDMYWSVLRYGQGERQPGPELAAFWFLRNAKIFNKLDQVVRPGDRVLIVYGAGHGYWLREIVARTPGYALEPVGPYLEKAASD